MQYLTGSRATVIQLAPPAPLETLNYESMLQAQIRNREIPKRERTRLSMMAAACRLLQNLPLNELSVDKMLNEAVLARGTFYLHFSDFDQFLSQLLTSCFEATWNSRPPQLRTSDPLLKIRHVNRYYCRLYEQNSGLMSAFRIYSLHDKSFAAVVGAFNKKYCNMLVRVFRRRYRRDLLVANERELKSTLLILCAATDEALRSRFVQRDKSLCECFPSADSLAEHLSIVWGRALFGKGSSE
jgi:AcrR family transcriptional regulator